MRKFHSMAIACAVLIGSNPVVAAAQANHNTARSNKNTVAAPAGEVSSAGASGEQKRSSRKGYQYFKARSDMSAEVVAPASNGQGPGASSKDTAPVSGTGAGGAAEANINTSRSNTKGSAAPDH